MSDQTEVSSTAIPQSPFEQIKRIDPDGNEFWSARDLTSLLDYASWQKFKNVLAKAQIACENSNNVTEDHFAVAIKVVLIGSDAKREIEDMHLSRLACYLVIQNADPSKPVVALGQTYFAVQTHRQEIGTPQDFSVFQNHGYKGLYNGMTAQDIHKKKHLKKSQNILDHMGSLELAANLFCSAQAEDKLRTQNTKGKDNANRVHYAAGVAVRRTMQEFGNTLPEDLSTVDSIKKLERQQKNDSTLLKTTNNHGGYMPLKQIKLDHDQWEYFPSKKLGIAGGFGEVFLGKAQDGTEVAIKRLKLGQQRSAIREVRIADYLLVGRTFENIIPTLDAGLDAESGDYFIVMAKAEYNLQDDVESSRPFIEKIAIGILRQIVTGLLEVSEIVHRDIKPQNILYHQENWKISDFGIARFVEETTSENTLKESMSRQYAAPEQWRLERTTQKTDVYALGCIAYCLLMGKPPFVGTRENELRDHHLNDSPPELPTEYSPQLRNLVISMLSKAPLSRPSLEHIADWLRRLEDAKPTMGVALSQFAEASAKISETQLSAEAKIIAQQEAHNTRISLAESAVEIYKGLVDGLFEIIRQNAPNAQIDGSSKSLDRQVKIGSATLNTSVLANRFPIERRHFPKSQWDIVTGAIISVTQQQPQKYYWSANLWYTNRGKEDYRWWEVCYMDHPYARSRHEYEPFSIEDDFNLVDIAASEYPGTVQFAAPNYAIDLDGADKFYERWLDLFAKVINGQLTHPTLLPLS